MRIPVADVVVAVAVDLVVVAERLRVLSRQVDPPYSIPLIVAASFPDVIITGRQLPAGVEEIVSVTADGPLIIYRRELSTAERRFAIAHAIAHLLFDAVAAGVRPGVPFDAAVERRADAFALELLAPAVRMERDVVVWPDDGGPDSELYADQVDAIAATYHVPPSVIDQQIRKLQRATKL